MQWNKIYDIMLNEKLIYIKCKIKKGQNMKIGYIFPGQGTQVVGMGKDLYEKYDEVKDVYKRNKESN